jgi:hypothetical protein
MTTTEDPRVAIAKDVLKQLPALNPSKGTYVYKPNGNKNLHPNDQAQQHIDQISEDCQVCALGACFLSYIRLFNKITVDEITYIENSIDPAHHTVKNALREHFANEQLALIEAAFEGFRSPADTTAVVKVIEDFYNKHPNPKKRLKAIMQNIIDNNGEFKP